MTEQGIRRSHVEREFVIDATNVRRLLAQIDALTAERAAETALLDAVEADRAQVIAERDALRDMIESVVSVMMADDGDSGQIHMCVEADPLPGRYRDANGVGFDTYPVFTDEFWQQLVAVAEQQPEKTDSPVEGGQSDG